MKIVLLMGSPRADGSSAAMSEAFCRGAKAAGHSVRRFDVAKMKIEGCRACEFCHSSGGGVCAINDDMAEVLAELKAADALVVASPIYYWTLSAQMHAAIQRMYAAGGAMSGKKFALILSSGSPDVYDAVISQFKSVAEYLNWNTCGIVTANGSECKSAAKLAEAESLAKSL